MLKDSPNGLIVKSKSFAVLRCSHPPPQRQCHPCNPAICCPLTFPSNHISTTITQMKSLTHSISHSMLHTFNSKQWKYPNDISTRIRLIQSIRSAKPSIIARLNWLCQEDPYESVILACIQTLYTLYKTAIDPGNTQTTTAGLSLPQECINDTFVMASTLLNGSPYWQVRQECCKLIGLIGAYVSDSILRQAFSKTALSWKAKSTAQVHNPSHTASHNGQSHNGQVHNPSHGLSNNPPSNPPRLAIRNSRIT